MAWVISPSPSPCSPAALAVRLRRAACGWTIIAVRNEEMQRTRSRRETDQVVRRNRRTAGLATTSRQPRSATSPAIGEDWCLCRATAPATIGKPPRLQIAQVALVVVPPGAMRKGLTSQLAALQRLQWRGTGPDERWQFQVRPDDRDGRVVPARLVVVPRQHARSACAKRAQEERLVDVGLRNVAGRWQRATKDTTRSQNWSRRGPGHRRLAPSTVGRANLRRLGGFTSPALGERHVVGTRRLSEVARTTTPTTTAAAPTPTALQAVASSRVCACGFAPADANRQTAELALTIVEGPALCRTHQASAGQRGVGVLARTLPSYASTPTPPPRAPRAPAAAVTIDQTPARPGDAQQTTPGTRGMARRR